MFKHSIKYFTETAKKCGFITLKRKIKMQLHNQHIITALNHECDKRIKELDSDSPHGDYIFYSFQNAINSEKNKGVK